jgi:hypothetical protein
MKASKTFIAASKTSKKITFFFLNSLTKAVPSFFDLTINTMIKVIAMIATNGITILRKFSIVIE